MGIAAGLALCPRLARSDDLAEASDVPVLCLFDNRRGSAARTQPEPLPHLTQPSPSPPVVMELSGISQVCVDGARANEAACAEGDGDLVEDGMFMAEAWLNLHLR